MSLSPSFDPHGVYFFTSASSTPANNLNPQGVPITAYPAHVLAASTTSSSSLSSCSSSSRAQPPNNSLTGAGQSALGLSLTQGSPIPMQSPQPRHPAQTRGFAVGKVTPAVKGQQMQQTNKAIFEPFKHERANTPDLDEVIKKKSGQWNQWELEQSLSGN